MSGDWDFVKRAESDVTDLSDLGVSMVEELDQL